MKKLFFSSFALIAMLLLSSCTQENLTPITKVDNLNTTVTNRSSNCNRQEIYIGNLPVCDAPLIGNDGKCHCEDYTGTHINDLNSLVIDCNLQSFCRGTTTTHPFYLFGLHGYFYEADIELESVNSYFNTPTDNVLFGKNMSISQQDFLVNKVHDLIDLEDIPGVLKGVKFSIADGADCVPLGEPDRPVMMVTIYMCEYEIAEPGPCTDCENEAF